MTVPDKLTFAIHGLGCMDCVAAIENAVMPLMGVAYVGVSLSGGTMTVRPGPGFDLPSVVSRVQRLGYGVGEEVDADLPRAAGCPCRAPSAVGGRTQVQ